MCDAGTFLLSLEVSLWPEIGQGDTLCDKKERPSVMGIYSMIKRIKYLLFLAVTVTFLLSSSAAAANGFTKKQFYAHRGDEQHAPENTMAAFKTAKKNGYKGFECDVRSNRQGMFYIFHDENLQRMFGEDIDITDITEENRLNYVCTYKNASKFKTKDLYIPTLKQVLEYARKKKITAMLHLKDYRLSDEEIEQLCLEVRETKAARRAVFISKNPSVIAKLKAHSGIQAGYLCDARKPEILEKGVSTALDIHADFICYITLGKHYLKKAHIKRAHKNGLDAGIYYVKARSELKKYYKMKADFVLSRKVLF